MIQNSHQLSMLAMGFVRYTGVDLAIFYVFLPGSGFGEAWLDPASYVQLGGLCILLFGTAVRTVV
ncbi:hypothetical protein B484DRAFT_394914 [Ochromonadaceae sp. CCMP2298]|nr:hypothetical protein B484DRAFT_394914 [Ochromonadaceae sp. CCMP2298]